MKATLGRFAFEHELWIRWAAAAVAGGLAILIVPDGWPGDIRFLIGWDLALAIALALPWWVIARSDSARSRVQARETDPGNAGLLAVSVLVSAASLAGAVLVLAEPNPQNPGVAAIGMVLVVLAIFGGWALLQTAFTLHYASIYYGESGDPSGLVFPGGPPDDLDFAYLAFGIGVACQVSDVATTNGRMRRLVLVHSVIAFCYNLAILGLMVNLLAGRL